MKKNKLLLLCFIGITIVYVTILIVDNIFGISFRNAWFSVTLFAIGAYASCYYLAYKMDSSLYYGALLMNFANATFMRYFKNYTFSYYYPMYIGCFAFASLSVFVVFRQKIHLYVFAILFMECILLIGYKNNYLNLLSVIIVNIAYLLLVLLNIIIRVRRNLRRVK